MEEALLQKIEELDKKVDEMRVSVERVRKYFLWSLIATLVFFLLPLIGLAIALPYFLSTFGSIYEGLL